MPVRDDNRAMSTPAQPFALPESVDSTGQARSPQPVSADGPPSTEPAEPRTSAPGSPSSPRCKPELLAPAGDKTCLLAAVENGADAVYFGLKRHNARIRAMNFDGAELAEVMA